MQTETIDAIDQIVSQVFGIDVRLLRSGNRMERVAMARFLAIYLRHGRGEDIEEVSRYYSREAGGIRYAIRRVRDMLNFNPAFRKKHDAAIALLVAGRVPYSPSLMRPGARVWTRKDSRGNERRGIVTSVTGNVFTVESFDDPNLRTVNRVDDGRLLVNCETSLDIVSVEN